MDTQVLPDDFKEFLRLLTESEVEYLLTGGYAVGYHGHPRLTPLTLPYPALSGICCWTDD